MKLASRLLAVLIIFLGILGGGCYWILHNQGLTPEEWKNFSRAKVEFDEDGIPTITADTWNRAVYTQGFVMASERLWQMDLIRRKVSGRLSEWFGRKLLSQDTEKRIEDRIQIADDAVLKLAEEERQFCDSYAEGVNDFIKQYPRRWGIEYLIQGATPEPWLCRDSILVLMEMTEQLTARENVKLSQEKIRARLPKSWQNFLYTQNHPWNDPMFGDAADTNDVPKPEQWLAMSAIPKGDISIVHQPNVNGSNNWGYRSLYGTFLANDPHLKNAVPSIWYLQRLQLLDGTWVVGAGLPGIFGVIIGMNKDIAWTFTNTGMDVDNILWEQVDTAKSQYLDKVENGHEIWRAIERKTFEIKVAQQGDVSVVAEFTSRGPLKKEEEDGRYYSRQWLGLKPEYFKMPIIRVNQAKSLEEADAALNNMTNPSQNAILADRKGNMMYRPTGVYVRRQPTSGPHILDALTGQWLGIEEMGSRWHIRIPGGATTKSEFIATANERIWMDPYGHYWADDDRKDRIRSILQSNSEFTQQDIEKMQLDSVSRFKKALATWVSANANDSAIRPEDRKRLADFTGDAKQDSEIFHLCALMERQLLSLLVAQVKSKFLPGQDDVYQSMRTHAVMLKTITHPDSTTIFGLNPKEVASHLWQRVEKDRGVKHEYANRWTAQHPFVGRIPLIGQIFRVREIPQFGSPDSINAQKPEHGPSLRIVFNLRDPENSTWILPVGQSGHVGKATYKNMQDRWERGEMLAIF